jgi:predicted transcriptional regulator
MAKSAKTGPSRRERQIMDVVYRLGKATVGEVLKELPHQPSYSTVRTQLRILEEKGYLRHEEEGLRYVYKPVVSREKARESALSHMVETFFSGSVSKVVATLLSGDSEKVPPEEFERLARLIEVERKRRDA